MACGLQDNLAPDWGCLVRSQSHISKQRGQQCEHEDADKIPVSHLSIRLVDGVHPADARRCFVWAGGGWYTTSGKSQRRNWKSLETTLIRFGVQLAHALTHSRTHVVRSTIEIAQSGSSDGLLPFYTYHLVCATTCPSRHIFPDRFRELQIPLHVKAHAGDPTPSTSSRYAVSHIHPLYSSGVLPSRRHANPKYFVGFLGINSVARLRWESPCTPSRTHPFEISFERFDELTPCDRPVTY